jgi:hypothetical protein
MGEEYKARQDAAKKAAEQYAFQAKVNEIARRTNDPGLPKRVELAMSLMSESNRRAAVQATVLGGAVTDVAANLTGGADAGRDFASALQSGRTTMQDLTHGTAVLNDKFQGGTSNLGEAVSKVTIATGNLAEVSQAYDQQQQDSFKANSSNIDKALKDADTLAGAHGGLQGELMGVEQQAQSLKIAIQKELTPTIQTFAKVSNELLEGIRKAVGSATGKGSGGHSFMEAVGHIISTAAGYGMAGAAGGAVVGGVAGGIAGFGAGALPGAGLGWTMGEIGGGVVGGLKGLYDTTLGEYAEGGIADGPKSGYSATLHGTEAVVPLPDGKNIPVSLDTGLTSAVQTQTGVLQDILRAMKDNNSLTSGILQASQ